MQVNMEKWEEMKALGVVDYTMLNSKKKERSVITWLFLP